MIDFVTLLLWGATGLRALGILVFVLGVLPKAYQETRHKDMLVRLRWAIFFMILIYVLLQFLGLTTFITNPKDVDAIIKIIRNSGYFNFLSLVNSLGLFVISIIMYFVYRMKYYEYSKDSQVDNHKKLLDSKRKKQWH